MVGEEGERIYMHRTANLIWNTTDKYVETEIDITVTVNPRVVVINWTNTNNLVYNKTAQKPTATVTNLVNNDVVGLTVAGEQINAGTYTATASFAGEQINYILPEVVTTEYSILEKEITVTIENKTSEYGEAPKTLTAIVEDGAIESGDKDVYKLSCEVTKTSGVKTYVITGEDISLNYKVTFVNGNYEVTKRHITATAEDKTIKFGEEIPDLTFTLSEEEIDKNVLAELTEKLIITCDADSSVSGKYSINISFNNDYTSETVLENYEVTLENGNFYVLAKVLENNGVEVAFENTEEAFDYEISVEVEIVETETEQSLDYDAISKQYVARRQEISKVYSVKLLRSEIVNGEETLVEIQPKDINDGTVIIIKIQIPEKLIGRNFRILHIHSAEDIEYVDESNIEVKDGFAYVKVNRLSEFAFVNLKDNEEMNHKSFCMGWLLFILDLIMIAFFIIYIILKKEFLLGMIGLIASAISLLYGVVTICLHICIITIIALVLAVLIFGAYLTFFLLEKKKSKTKTAK